MSDRIIDVGLTETDLVNALLEKYNYVKYDPARHLIASVAAACWGITAKAASERLKVIARDEGLRYIDVIQPDGHVCKAVEAKKPGD